MCIICNASAGDKPLTTIDEASDFLAEFKGAQDAMKAATARMLTLSKTMAIPEHRKRYDRTHKQMLRVIRDWNNIEHTREQDTAAVDGPADYDQTR